MSETFRNQRWSTRIITAILAFGAYAPPGASAGDSVSSRPGVFYTLKDAPGVRSRKPRSLMHRLLDAEMPPGLVTSEMRTLVDRLETRARATIPRPAEQTEAEAVRVFTEIHRLLSAEGFVYPSEGYVGSLSEGLSPTTTTEAETERLRRTPENAARAEAFEGRPTGPFYIADCDILSFLYLGVADVLDAPLRFMERQRRFNGDPGHNWVRWQLGSGRTFDWDPMTGRPYSQGAEIAQPLSDAEFTGYLWALVGDNYERAWAFHEARAAYEACLRSGERSVAVLNSLAWKYATSPDPLLRSPSVAVQYAKEAMNGAPDIATYVDTYAAALARSGEYSAALAAECRAIRLETQSGNRASYIRAAALYKSGKPLVQDRPRQAQLTSMCTSLFDGVRGRAPLEGKPFTCFAEQEPLEDPCRGVDDVSAGGRLVPASNE